MFSIGQFAKDNTLYCQGLSFTPSIAGPNGSGHSTKAHCTVTRLKVGFPSAVNDAPRPEKVYIYSRLLNQGGDTVGQNTAKVGESNDAAFADGVGIFGAGILHRDFEITSNVLTTNTKYYIYFDPAEFTVNIKGAEVYGGGAPINANAEVANKDVEFQIELLDAN